MECIGRLCIVLSIGGRIIGEFIWFDMLVALALGNANHSIDRQGVVRIRILRLDIGLMNSTL